MQGFQAGEDLVFHAVLVCLRLVGASVCVFVLAP